MSKKVGKIPRAGHGKAGLGDTKLGTISNETFGSAVGEDYIRNHTGKW